MAALPDQILVSSRRKFPRIDETWLQQCYSWVHDQLLEQAVDPTSSRGIAKINLNVSEQVLKSDLEDSMQGHGLDLLSQPPQNRPERLLVQIVDLTDVGVSAFNLKNTRATRIERVDLTGLGEEQEEGQDDEGPVPNYQRSMLKFILSDGIHHMPAIEYRKFSQLKLGDTPLGFKMYLSGRNILVQNGIIFLEPSMVELAGQNAEDLDEHRDKFFLNGLRLRLGEEIVEDKQLGENEQPQPNPPAAVAAAAQPPPAAAAVPPPACAPHPAPQPQPVAGPSRSSAPVKPSPTHSPYFAKDRAKLDQKGQVLARERLLSPARTGPIRYDAEMAEPGDEWDDQDMMDMMNEMSAPARNPPPPPSPPKDNADASSEYEFDEVDMDMLERADEIESQMQVQPATSAIPSTEPSQHSSSLPVHVPPPPQARQPSRPPRATQACAVPAGEMIEIGDSSDEKENAPVPSSRRAPSATARTRRRPRAEVPKGGEIIEISD